MSEEILLRRARPKDSEAIRDLSEQLGYPSTLGETEERLAIILGREDHALFVAENQDGRAIAWVHGMLRPLLVEKAHIEIGGLVVDADYRNRQIGEKLMKVIESWAAELGTEEVHVYSNVIREDAHRFYERIGYEGYKQSKVFRKGI